MKLQMLILVLITISCAKNDYGPGNCVISPDGFTWKINKIENNKYIAEGWQRETWGKETSLDFQTVSASSGFQVITCPTPKN